MFAVVITLLLWASAFVGIRIIGANYSPGALSLGRLLIGTLVLSFFAIPTLKKLPKGWLTWRTGFAIFAYSLMWFAGYNVALNTAEQHLDAGTSALLINIAPILIAIFAGIFLREGFPRWLVIGGVVSLAGVALIALGSGQRSSVDLLGIALCLLAAVFAALSVIIQKPVLRSINAVHATWLGTGIGAICCLPFSGELIAAIDSAPIGSTLGVVYLGIFPTAIAFTSWAYALSRFNAGQLAASTYLVPAITVLMSWVLLNETPTAWGFIGGFVALLGVAITRIRPRNRLD
ncbi:membrane protein [Psychromicrobium lacuslunae]|uniref:Membrane protein n=1 Tax=Psychromicrobium lacuslunae TaxID=1618207 RepID=A0A0D4C3L3_9MICC|nr:DMT family transporter [Psychromicrobium lacuslunae]AJT43183.1 membrane protein [Psychromicrobium lacuslunae]